MQREFWLAVTAYVVPTFVLGFVWHLKTFASRYERLEVYRKNMIIPMGLASMMLQAVAFAWIYPRLFSTATGDWPGSALRFGALFGALAWSFAVLPFAAKYRMTSVRSFLALETAFTAVPFAVVSPMIALAWRQ
jgi:hypothetical protein